MIFRIIFLYLFFFTDLIASAQNFAKNPGNYNIIWNSQSTDATGSMPVGGGNLGLNAWVENGELLFYIGSPDAFDEKGNVIKLGRIRIKSKPNIFSKSFQQELVLNDGYIRFKGKSDDETITHVKLWVDVSKPIVHVEIKCTKPVQFVSSYETWPFEKPRFLAEYTDNGLTWSYQLDQDLYSKTRLDIIRQSGMEGLESKVPDPGRDLILGGKLIAPGMIPSGETSGKYMATTFKGLTLETSKKVKKLDLTLIIGIDKYKSLDNWKAAIHNTEQEAIVNKKSNFKKTVQWWNEFQDRSYIKLEPRMNKRLAEKDSAWLVGRNYQLFRYMLGCNSTGKFPTLFNGGFFNVDVPLPSDQLANQSPDARVWGSVGFMAQNQRLLYWPLIKSGDEDVLKIGLNFYQDRAEVQRARALQCFGVDGTPFPEALNWCGLFSDGLGAKSGHSSAKHLEYHYTSTLDFAFMMLEAARSSGESILPYLPTVEGIVSYYDQNYRKENKKRAGSELNAQGKLVIYPSSAVEFAQGAKNNTDVLAGLYAITDGLLSLPKGVLSPEKLTYYQKFLTTIPSYPTDKKDGKEYLAIAESFESNSTWQNLEFPQMYSVFPFQQFGVGLKDIDLVKNTWKYGWINRAYQDDYICWYQNGIFTARMGMTDSAKNYTIRKFLHSGEPPRLLYKQWPTPCYPMRFPTFYNTFTFDHAPDMDHGGSAMVGLQEMLMQTPGNKILLFPAWPPDWNVDFKLHAPYKTIVEVSYKKGEIVKMKVTPASRSKDVIVSFDKQ